MIALLRLFIHQADLSEPGDHDWDSIQLLANQQDRECIEDSRYMPGLSSFTWVVKMLKSSIRENIDATKMATILWETSLHWSNKDMKAILADLPSPTHIAGWIGWTPLHYCVWFQDYIPARSLVQQSAIIHLMALEIYWSPVEESPTSISLYSSTAFLAWRQLLEAEQLPFEDFITQELQGGRLKSENWNKYSLMQVFTLNLEPAVYPDHHCELCNESSRSFSLVEIAWQDILQQFNPQKETIDLLDDLRLMDGSSSFGSVGNHVQKCPSDTLCDDAPENYSYEIEWVCVYCWHTMIGTPGATDFDSVEENSDESDSGCHNSDCDDSDDRGDESNSDDSPFLLSI
jgi:hypothetical protein